MALAAMWMQIRQSSYVLNISSLSGKPLQLIDHFIYLSRNISSTESNVNICLAKAWMAIDRLSIIWKSDLSDKINMTQGQFFKQSLTGFNSKFSFSQTSCFTKAEEPSLPYYLPITGGRIIGFIPFPRVLVLCEMQSVSSRIWTHVVVSISYDNNHYTTGTSSNPWRC